MSLSIVKTFVNIYDAHVLRARLELEGIPCFGIRENGDMVAHFNGYFELKVSTEDIEQALKIVNKIADSPITDEAGDVLKCPSCESTSFYDNFVSMSHFSVKRCRECEYEIIRE